MQSHRRRQSPIDFREHCIGDPEEKGRHAPPVELGTGHTIRAHFVDPPFVANLSHLVPPVLGVDLDASMGLSDIRFEDVPFRVRLRPEPLS